MTATQTPLADNLAWLGTPNCTCPHEWKSYGRLYGISMGKGWARMATEPACPNHGAAAPTSRKADR
jgi:hypothetical protein